MKRLTRHVRSFCLIGVLALTGCVSTGRFDTAVQTRVRLGEGNYRLVATGVGGEASAAYLLGHSTGRATAALVHLGGERHLNEAAVRRLWANFAQEHGEVEGRRLALVNVRQDARALNTFLYVRPVVSVRADVVEFVDAEEGR